MNPGPGAHGSMGPSQRPARIVRWAWNTMGVLLIFLLSLVALMHQGSWLSTQGRDQANSSRSGKDSGPANTVSSPGSSDAAHELKLPIVDKASFHLVDNNFLGSPDIADLPFSENGFITAILPVTKESLQNLRSNMYTMAADHSPVSAVVLVCPRHTLTELTKIFREGLMETFIDISVLIWEDGLAEGPAALAASSHATTEHVLVMDSEGLTSLDEESQVHLLSHFPYLDAPSSFCGGLLAGNPKRATCVLPKSASQKASFPLPPFIIPSSTVHGWNITGIPESDFWPALSNRLSQGSTIGALVQEVVNNSVASRCYQQCRKHGLATDDSDLGTCETTTGNKKPVDLPPPVDPSRSSTLAIILPTLSDLEGFSATVCNFIKRGSDVHTLILSRDLSHDQTRDPAYPWLHDHLISSTCEIAYSALHSSANDYANAEAASFWLSTSSASIAVIIYGAYDDRISPFDIELEKYKSLGTTVIKIPQRDLPFCDWVASLSLVELRNWHTPELELVVITDDRPTSLERLLRSLSSARFFGDEVKIRINLEQTADAETRDLVDAFHWPHGPSFTHHRVIHAGLLTAIVESWYPKSNNSYAVILEDDVEVSPLFYAWAKMTLLFYRYGASHNRSPSLFGVSLYQQKHNELRPEGRKPFNARSLFDSHGVVYRNTPYLSQVPCSWGALYFPEHWKEFHSYLTVRFSEAWIPLDELVAHGVRSNRWRRSWKKFFIEMVYLRGYLMLYPNFDDFMSLSTNHLEVGSHVKDEPRHIYDRKKSLFTLPLFVLPFRNFNQSKPVATGLTDLPGECLPNWSDLPVLDLLGDLTTGVALQRRGLEQQKELTGCQTLRSETNRQWSYEAEELFTCA